MPAPYTFTVKDSGPDLLVIITRALLALAGLACLVYSNSQFYINIIAGVLLLLMAVFTKLILVKFAINRMILLVASAIILFIATGSIIFAIILIAYGFGIKYLLRKTTVEVKEEGIFINRLLGNKHYPWQAFTNIVLKDNLLTMDMTSNVLLQLSIEEEGATVDEPSFDAYCAAHLATTNNTTTI